jgi:hypothetical protein
MSTLKRIIRPFVSLNRNNQIIQRFSSVGVVRVVKAPSTEESLSKQESETFDNPLTNRSSPSNVPGNKVPNDLRAADLFRTFKLNPDKSTVISVLEGLSSLQINGKVLAQFPGFVDLITELNGLLVRNELNEREFLKVVECCRRMGIRINEQLSSVGNGFSNQLVHVLDNLSKKELAQTVATLVIDMRAPLDEYLFWCLNKEVNSWASDEAISDADFISGVLGPLQVFAQSGLSQHLQPVFTNPLIEDRVIRLMKAGKLNRVQIMELIVKMHSAGYPRMVQQGIKTVLGAYKEKLVGSLEELSVLIHALPKGTQLRDPQVQRELAEILLHHLSSAELQSADRVKILLTSAAKIITNPSDMTELEILRKCSSLILDNAVVAGKLEADAVANLYYMAASAAVSVSESDRAAFLTICHQTESLIVGRLPSMSTSDMAKVALSFSSGIVSHSKSFKALTATIKQKANAFTPSDFVDAIYALAYKGNISKALLVMGNVDAVASKVPANALPRIAWATAVAGLPAATVWDTLIKRIEREILLVPAMLESLSRADSSMLYEVLVACKVNRYMGLSKNADRRMQELESAWRPPQQTGLDYASLLEKAKIKVRSSFQPKRLQFAMTEVPIYLPEYKVVIDATRDPIVGGSVNLRHSLWSKLELNVLGISDAQFAPCKTEDDKAVMLASIIAQFVQELQLKKIEVTEVPLESHDWNSRRPSKGDKNKEEWESRQNISSRNVSRPSAFDKSAGWTDRPE